MPCLSAIAFELGEQRQSYEDIQGLSEFLATHKIPMKPTVYGWGDFFRTEKTVLSLGLLSAQKTIAASNIDPGDVQLVIFCCIHFPGDKYDHGDFVAELVGRLGLSNALPIGVTLNNCLTLLSAVSLASAMVRSGQVRNALVVSADRVADEAERIHPFAIFSDAAVSCLISSSHVTGGFEILTESFAQNKSSDDISDLTQKELYQEVATNLLNAHSYNIKEIAKVFTINLFRPIVLLKETQSGCGASQVYLDNIPRVGHCNAGDPLINLASFASEGGIRPGERYILAADAPKLRGALLLTAL